MRTFFLSYTDDLITYWFTGIVFGLILLNYLFKWVKSLKRDRIIFNEDSICKDIDVGNYTFNFENVGNEVETIKATLFTKMILFSMALLLVLVPFYEFVETLKPTIAYPFWSCFP
ncbi:hypothetical protein [Seonamhaeicola maritimus]|uniref:Uncharacterized protein n=1 Tax=Seonamhaeicola maritimus TaxID=2591822 RepID=A0A5C7GJX1_9FLAO|nr:hypothetical protein [Seonamhaeicola maritimus]TXG38574.1 hypothetical protein FUA22_01415 [Seonamhaeicola maritimus]